MCASIGVYEKFKLEAFVDGTKFHFSKERFCVSPWGGGGAENGTHPLLLSLERCSFADCGSDE